MNHDTTGHSRKDVEQDSVLEISKVLGGGICPDAVPQFALAGASERARLHEFNPRPSFARTVRKSLQLISPHQGDWTHFEDFDRAHSEQTSGGKAMNLPVWKRSLDIILVLLAVPLWLPLMILIACWIKSVSRGPVFYRQTRVGMGAKSFTMLKFRSMKTGSETLNHENHFKSLVQHGCSMLKLDSLKDPRIIAGGRLLRALGLDELPQLFNVLSGEMSLVGPRPCLPAEMECYADCQKARFDVAPGITGYWQVSGKNKATFNQMVEMDLIYRDRMSPVFDLVILFGTVPALAMQAIESCWQPIRVPDITIPAGHDSRT
jgi:lipopolysaccharide/colanic/teichoic acid biosynthesis glycosyltransferase